MINHQVGPQDTNAVLAAEPPQANNNEHSWDPWGDRIGQKQPDTLRIALQNFNGLSGRTNDPADESLPRWVNQAEIDIFGISEVNLWWPQVRKELQFDERVAEWWNPRETRALCAYNKHDPRTFIKKKTTQYGGTGQISRHDAAA